MLICFCGDGYDPRASTGRGRRGHRKAWSGVIVVAFVALAVWVYLLTARGAFWRCAERADGEPTRLALWPRVAAVVPARNEADGIGASIGALLGQDYPGPWTVVLVDDDSNDGTADIARRAAAENPKAQLRIVTSHGLPAGWTGK